MCRSIRTLFNFEPPATDEEIRAASRVLVGTRFNAADPHDRAIEAERAKARARAGEAERSGPRRGTV